jgi:hypothetical protein
MGYVIGWMASLTSIVTARVFLVIAGLLVTQTGSYNTVRETIPH